MPFAFDFGGMTGGAFSGFGGACGGSRGSNLLRQSPAYVVPNGTPVVVRGLKKTPEHNGKSGRVTKFGQSRARYEVAVESGPSLYLRPQNLTQMCEFEVIGLENKPELNGKLGDIVNYDEESGRYVVLLRQPPLACSLQRGNCLLKQGTRIV